MGSLKYGLQHGTRELGEDASASSWDVALYIACIVQRIHMQIV